jgi:hypothetical protein
MDRCLSRLTLSSPLPQVPLRRVRVVPADPEAMRLHRPAAGGQVRQREPLAVETEELALAGPLRDRSEAAGA